MFVTINLGAGRDQNILGETNPAQTTMGALHSLNVTFLALRYDYHQIHITIVIGSTPGVGTEEPDLFRLKFRHKPLSGSFQQTFIQRLHTRLLAQANRQWKSRLPVCSSVITRAE